MIHTVGCAGVGCAATFVPPVSQDIPCLVCFTFKTIQAIFLSTAVKYVMILGLNGCGAPPCFNGRTAP